MGVTSNGIHTVVEVHLGEETYKNEDENEVTAKQAAHIDALMKTNYGFKDLPTKLQHYSISKLGKSNNLQE